MTTRASSAERETQRSRSVRGSDVARRWRITTTAFSSRSQWRMARPRHDRVDDAGSAMTSTGFPGSQSSPCIQAAVRPPNVIAGPRARRHAVIKSHGSALACSQRYIALPSLFQVLLLSALSDRPAPRASSKVNGPLVSSGGMVGRRATRQPSRATVAVTTQLVNRRAIRIFCTDRAKRRPSRRVIWTKRAEWVKCRQPNNPKGVPPSLPTSI